MKVNDILEKRFGRSFFGYDPRQVDLFLDDIIDAFEASEREKKEMLTALEYLLKEIERYEKEDRTGEKTDGAREKPGKTAFRPETELPRGDAGSGSSAFRRPRKPWEPEKKAEDAAHPDPLQQPEKESGESLVEQLLRDYPPEEAKGGDPE